MDRPNNTAQTLCTRCQTNPRLSKQRWCRNCLTAVQRERREAQRVAQADNDNAHVTHAAIQPLPRVTQAAAPALPEAVQGLTEALQEYSNAVHEWQVRRQPRQGWLQQDRTSIMVQVAQRLEHARQRLGALGINLKALEGE